MRGEQATMREYVQEAVRVAGVLECANEMEGLRLSLCSPPSGGARAPAG